MAGFDHSAFTFSYEAYLAQAQISPTEVPPGALVAFLQKGLQFSEIEANLNDVSEKVVWRCAPFLFKILRKNLVYLEH